MTHRLLEHNHSKWEPCSYFCPVFKVRYSKEVHSFFPDSTPKAVSVFGE